MRLVLALDPSPIEFTEPLDGGAYPWLVSVGTLRLAARAGKPSGIAVGESPSLSVKLDNAGKQAVLLFGFPMRVRAEVYDAAGDLFFAGSIASIEYDRTVALDIEA